MKPKAPAWLREAFADGVDELAAARGTNCSPEFIREQIARGRAFQPTCWLAQFDPARRPCEGKLERAHLIPRQRVEAAMWEALRGARILCFPCGGSGTRQAIGRGGGGRTITVECPWCDGAASYPLENPERDELILLAAWDPRNAEFGCEGHHRRFDKHRVSVPREQIVVPAIAVPGHAMEFIGDYGLDDEADRQFPGFLVEYSRRL